MTHDLHPVRLGTTNEDGSRAFVHQADYSGFWNTRRTFAHVSLMALFFLLPLLRYDGEQMILLDVINRRFVFFGQIFWAHDFPVFYLLAVAVFIAVLYVTAVWGRVWCGWGCPQTVFVDGIYRRLERWIEGDHLARRKLDLAPWSAQKMWRRGAKWFSYLLVTSLIVFCFMAYFAGSKALATMLLEANRVNLGYYLVMLVLGAILLLDFAWFREQYCVIICPYGRLQSVLMDTSSITVLYDEKRGEPRRGSVGPLEETGDCVDCSRCIDVCPTGIDIRRGVQMECLNCTACMDACDQVMTKVKKRPGLIRYESLLGRSNHPRINIRASLYLGVIVALTVAFVLIIAQRQPLDYEFLRARGELYSTVKVQAEEFILNRFQVQVSSQTREDVEIEFSISPDLETRGVQITTPFRPLPLKVGEIRRTELFVRFPKLLLNNGSGVIQLETVARGKLLDERRSHSLPLVGPLQ